MRRFSLLVSSIVFLLMLLPATVTAQTTNCTTQTLSPYTYTIATAQTDHRSAAPRRPWTRSPYTDCNQTGTRAPAYVAPPLNPLLATYPTTPATGGFVLPTGKRAHGQQLPGQFQQLEVVFRPGCGSTRRRGRPGHHINMGNGTQKYLARGTFVKVGTPPPSIGCMAHSCTPFNTWPQFLNAGGHPDLSNVVRFSSVTGAPACSGRPSNSSRLRSAAGRQTQQFSAQLIVRQPLARSSSGNASVWMIST